MVSCLLLLVVVEVIVVLLLFVPPSLNSGTDGKEWPFGILLLKIKYAFFFSNNFVYCRKVDQQREEKRKPLEPYLPRLISFWVFDLCGCVCLCVHAGVYKNGIVL